MSIHAALSTRRAQTLANGAPLVFLGDFNFKPGDGAYRLVTEGVLPSSDPSYPTAPEWEAWRPTLQYGMGTMAAAPLSLLPSQPPLVHSYVIISRCHVRIICVVCFQ